MPSKKPQFIIRAEQELFDKIKIIAKENERTANQEIVYRLKKAIEEYEKQNGEIEAKNINMDIHHNDNVNINN